MKFIPMVGTVVTSGVQVRVSTLTLRWNGCTGISIEPTHIEPTTLV